ncbi:MAG TPA: IS21 family transposase [Solirubrobacteraceae bacterium]|jgi:transposase|nr:IS21 family transposase [Solirubrobacteraceae bacterium]
MDQVHVIRHKVLLEGQSVRSVARQLGMSRNTVRKYLLVPAPVRVEGRPRARPVLERVRSRIEALLEQWRPRTTAKQRVTGTRLHRQLVEEGFQVGVTTVRAYLHELRRRAAEVFVPLVHRPGEGQVDFFEVTVDVGGERRKAWKFVLRLMYSGRDFVWLYDSCDQLSFLDGHVRAFAWLGWVPTRLVYDNLSAAVKRRMGLERELTERFLALVSHYLFEPCFARPGEGHDKGGVEARGKGIRLQHLTPIPQGESLTAIALAVQTELDRAFAVKVDAEGVRSSERLAQESRQGLPLPALAFAAHRVELVTVSRRSLVRAGGAQYSVPSLWAGLEATAYVGVETVRVVCGGEQVELARARRGRQVVHYRHYLPELAKKPQAVRQVAPELVAELGEPYGRLWELLVGCHGEREAGRVLARIVGAMVEHGEAEVTAALGRALSRERCDLLALSVGSPAATASCIKVPPALASYAVETARASDYDWLLGQGGRS